MYPLYLDYFEELQMTNEIIDMEMLSSLTGIVTDPRWDHKRMLVNH
jgi:hypothetical protein